MLGEKPGKRHDAELRPKVYLGKTFHLKQPQGRREEYLDSPRGPAALFWCPIPIRNRPCRYTSYYPLQSGDSHSGLPGPGIRPPVTPMVQELQR